MSSHPPFPAVYSKPADAANLPAKSKETRFFLCTGQCVKYSELYKYPESHIIGHLVYLHDEGQRVTGLARWDVSQPCDQVPMLAPKIDVIFIGDARGITCRFAGCNRVERWEIGKAAFLVLMSRYKVNHESI